VSTTVPEGNALTMDAFWKWLKEHANCVIQASTAEAHLYDQEDLHWHIAEEQDRTQVVQLIRGKQILAEILMDPREVLYIQSSPDASQPERFVFEVIAGSKDDTFVLCSFLMAHGFEDKGRHGELLKH
jgi:hypothetical protein